MNSRTGKIITGALFVLLLPAVALGVVEFQIPAGVATCPGGGAGCSVGGTVLHWLDTGGSARPATQANPLPVGAGVSSASDLSGTIAAGGSFQVLAAASTSRRSIEFANLCPSAGACTSAANNCYLFIAGAGTPGAGTNAVTVAPGGSYLRSVGNIPSDAIMGSCDGTGDHFSLKVQ